MILCPQFIDNKPHNPIVRTTANIVAHANVEQCKRTIRLGMIGKASLIGVGVDFLFDRFSLRGLSHFLSFTLLDHAFGTIHESFGLVGSLELPQQNLILSVILSGDNLENLINLAVLFHAQDHSFPFRFHHSTLLIGIVQKKKEKIFCVLLARGLLARPD